MFVCVLASLPVFEDSTAFSPETTDEFVSQEDAFRVGVGGYENRLFVVEIVLDIIVEIVEVCVRSVRDGDDVVPTALIERQGVHFALRDDTFFLPFYPVDVIREEFRS